MSLPDLNVWQAEVLRLSIFLKEPVNVKNQNWWSEVTGQSSETQTNKPSTGEYVEDGIVGDWRLSLNIGLARIDWIVYPINPKVNAFSTVGCYVEAVQHFIDLLSGWLSTSCPPVKRIAFGVVLIQEVAERISGYKLLKDYLPIVKIDPDSWSDLLFQVNHRMNSKVIADLEINQLAKWGVVRIAFFPMTGSGPQEVLSELSACRLEIDFSTSAKNETPFDPAKLKDLFIELKTLGDKLASEGDRG